jgi:hypothetical protein
MNSLANYNASLTDEQRADMLAKAAIARAAAKAQREANKLTLKMTYLDSNHWATLGSRFGVRMPLSGTASSQSVIRKYLKLCGVSREVFNEHYTSADYFLSNNKLWSAYATAGLILELKEQLTTA